MPNSEKINIDDIKKQKTKMGLLISWLPLIIFFAIYSIWNHLIGGFKLNTLSFTLFCLFSTMALYYQPITLVQSDFLYARRLLQSIYSSSLTDYRLSSFLTRNYIQFSNNQETDMKDFFTFFKKKDIDVYHYIGYMTYLAKYPLFTRKHYHLKQKIIHFIKLITLIIVISLFNTELVSKLISTLSTYVPNSVIQNSILFIIIYGLYSLLNIFLKRYWCHSRGDFGAILTFLETKKMIGNSIFSKEFIAQYLLNRCYARYGIDPACDKNIPPSFKISSKNFDSIVTLLVVSRIGPLQVINSEEYYNLLNKKDHDSFRLRLEMLMESNKFITKDIKIFMKSLTYRIPRLLL